jgi:predicted Zn-dependent protease
LFQTSKSLLENDVGEAERQFSVVKATPGIDSSLIESTEAYLYGAKGDLSEARRRFEELSKKLPYDYTSKAMLIANDIVMGHVTKARSAYEKLVEEFPYVSEVKQLEPALFLREEKYGAALTSAEWLLGMNPTDIGLLSTKAYALIEVGRANEALIISRQLNAKLPKDPTGMLIEARALLKMGRAKEAENLVPKIEAIQTYDIVWWPLMSTKALKEDIDKALGQ